MSRRRKNLEAKESFGCDTGLTSHIPETKLRIRLELCMHNSINWEVLDERSRGSKKCLPILRFRLPFGDSDGDAAGSDMNASLSRISYSFVCGKRRITNRMPDWDIAAQLIVSLLTKGAANPHCKSAI